MQPAPDHLLRLGNRLLKESIGCEPIRGVGLLEPGADSLLATRLVLRLGEAFKVHVPNRNLLECSAPETLVAAILGLRRRPLVAKAGFLAPSSESDQTYSFSEKPQKSSSKRIKTGPGTHKSLGKLTPYQVYILPEGVTGAA